MNKTRNTPRPKHEDTPPKKKRRFSSFTLLNKKTGTGKSVPGFFDGRLMTRENLVKQIPFIFYMTFLAIMYIANSYNAEKTIIDISKTKKELEELRFEYITTKSELMFHSKQSEVAAKLINSGVKESVVPPAKLYVKVP
ncbi:MAG: hypothetical protein H6541_00140 [Lentimicrobiaceae bacterium]|nr:hypothetical protein [Lentimicrobiaceae bacterium]MCB9023918.1 hypothetical protein [Lentimicrobiaceae bacterium]MCO5266460.1 FtsL-like putative cell division protein [Lentimicrobium sp.]HPG33553.1 FtsL-like putative cell division protein [Lentimicrobium sp.]